MRKGTPDEVAERIVQLVQAGVDYDGDLRVGDEDAIQLHEITGMPEMTLTDDDERDAADTTVIIARSRCAPEVIEIALESGRRVRLLVYVMDE